MSHVVEDTPTPESDPDGPSQSERDAYEMGKRSERRKKFRGGIQQDKLTIGVVASIIGLILGLIGGTAQALSTMESIAHKAVAPLELAQAKHLEAIDKALSPGGAMHEFKSALEAKLEQNDADNKERDAWVVDAIFALCKATPQARCPDPGRLIKKRSNNGN